jgi:GGDEF domain-containing protein
MRSDVEHRSRAVLDPLTAMLNRRALDSRAAELEEQSALIGEPIGVVLADVDHFKVVNDPWSRHRRCGAAPRRLHDPRPVARLRPRLPDRW